MKHGVGLGTVPRTTCSSADARVDADTVFRQDGSWYLLPACGAGSYATTHTERINSASTGDTITVNCSGRYSWNQPDSVVFLVGSMSGFITGTVGGVEMIRQETHLGDQPSQDFPASASSSRP